MILLIPNKNIVINFDFSDLKLWQHIRAILITDLSYWKKGRKFERKQNYYTEKKITYSERTLLQLQKYCCSFLRFYQSLITRLCL